MLSFPLLDITCQIISRGYNRAAISLASIIGQPVLIDASTSLVVHTFSPASLDFLPAGSLTVLTTDLFGAFSGRSLLIISKEEQKEIVRICLSGSPSGGSPEMQEALLLEIDNILSAAVISELANELAEDIYGGVPCLSQYDRTLLCKFLSNSELLQQPRSYCLISHARLVFANNQTMQPYFIWILPADLMEAIQQSGHSLKS